jgi:HSP90 family molecular chaperone
MNTFKVGIDFARILEAISRYIYDTPLAFIRENVQNAVDAVRIQAFREKIELADPSLEPIHKVVESRESVVIRYVVPMT